MIMTPVKSIFAHWLITVERFLGSAGKCMLGSRIKFRCQVWDEDHI